MSKDTMPKEIWAWQERSTGIVYWSSNKNDKATKYTRLDPDDIVISRKELENTMTNRATLLKQVDQTKKVDEVLKDWQLELVKKHLSGNKPKGE